MQSVCGARRGHVSKSAEGRGGGRSEVTSRLVSLNREVRVWLRILGIALLFAYGLPAAPHAQASDLPTTMNQPLEPEQPRTSGPRRRNFGAATGHRREIRRARAGS